MGQSLTDVNGVALPKASESSCNVKSMSCNRRPRFDHANIAAYYDYTRELLQPLADELHTVMLTLQYSGETLYYNENCSSVNIERWYSTIVNALNQASSKCIPQTTSCTLKHWWNDDLNN